MAKPKCPGCESTQVLYGKKQNMFRCRICGTEWKKQNLGGNRNGKDKATKAK